MPRVGRTMRPWGAGRGSVRGGVRQWSRGLVGFAGDTATREGEVCPLRDLRSREREQRQASVAMLPMATCACSALLMLAPPATPRAGIPHMGFFDWLLPDYDDMGLGPEAIAAVEDICRPSGWDVKCEIGSEVARSVGGSGQLASSRASGTAVLDLRLSFALDKGYSPPQGPVRLARSSRYFSEVGFWKVDADTDDGVPEQVQWRLQTDDGLVLGGQTLVPPGPCYFNMLYTPADGDGDGAGGGGSLDKGRITVKEDIGVNTGIFQAKGILAEFKIVGTCSAARAPDEG